MKKYRTEIDGLRTVAVIPVILFHMGLSFVKGGFFGVDVFFVISGYLITKILTDDIENGKFSIYRFWLRRIKRLLPLLLTVILVTLIITPVFVFKPVVKDISHDIFPALFSYFNFHALYDFSDYWGVKAKQSFFLHTWSLSVEEQFYLLYPIFLFISHKYFKNFVIPILTITLTSLLYFYIKINQDFDSAFYMLTTRIWEFSVGGLSGLIKVQKFKNSKVQKLLPIIGILFIAVSYLLGNKNLWILPVFGSSLIILFCTPHDITGKLLSTKLFVFIGKISYSLYLWHWVIIVLFKNLRFQFQNINHLVIKGCLIISLTFLLPYLSYNFIENKTRNYKQTPKIVIVGIVLIIGLTLYFKSHFFNVFYNSKYNRSTYYGRYYDISPTQRLLNTKDPLYHDVKLPMRLPQFSNAFEKEGIITNRKNGIPKIILIGDSHGGMWAKLLNEIADELNVTLSSYTTNGVKPFFNIVNINSQDGEYQNKYTKKQRIEYAKSIIANIEKWNPKIIILACHWEGYLGVKKEFNDLLLFLEKRNIEVLIFTQPPVLNFMQDKNASQYLTYLGLNPVEGYNIVEVSNPNVTKGNDYLKSLVSEYNNVRIYDVHKNMLFENKVKVSINKEVLYFDDDHLSYSGTIMHKQSILPIINSMINSNKRK